jgi:predicted RNA-binding protein with PIN domain
VEKDRWIVDGMNVIGSKPDGWWRDRPAAMRALAERLGEWADGRDVTVVFDGRPFEVSVDGVHVEFASRRGPNAADDDIVRLVEESRNRSGLCVVTSDHDLTRRVKGLGAEVISSAAFRRLLGE